MKCHLAVEFCGYTPCSDTAVPIIGSTFSYNETFELKSTPSLIDYYHDYEYTNYAFKFTSFSTNIYMQLCNKAVV